MENSITGYLTTGIDSFKNQLQQWSTFAKENYENLKSFRDKVVEKSTKNQLEAQMKQDVILSLETMMTSVQKDLIQPISKLDSQLAQDPLTDAASISDKFQSGYQLMSDRIKQINGSVSELRKRSKHFIKRQEFGMRHGYYRFFIETDQAQTIME